MERTFIKLVFLLLLLFTGSAKADEHGIAMFGSPRYSANFEHFDYVNPKAPKGGVLKFSSAGTFDSLNSLAPIGIPAFGLRLLVYESLMTRSLDEPFTLYGLLAQKVDMAPDRKSITFSLSPKAAFSDGSVVRVEDVIFSVKTLREKGKPNHRFYYRYVKEMKKIGARKIKFIFSPDANWEMPLIIGLMPIISKKHWQSYSFGKSRTKKPLGSGAYIVDEVELGSKIIYSRNKNYWGKDLSVNRGRFNFDKIHIEYYRDSSARFEAFKAGQFDFLEELSPTRWAKAYDFTALKKGLVVKKQFSLKTPAPMWAIVFNKRKNLFQDRLVRQALGLTFDAPWINKNLFFGLWKKSYSFWARSSLASASCCPQTKPLRQRKREAFTLLRQAGWEIKNNKLTNKTGKVFAFTILVKSRLNERIALVWKQQLAQFGISASIRFLDDSQFERRKQNFSYDVIFARWYLSLSPGNEQSYYWSSESSKTKGSRNYAGVSNPIIDRQIAAITNAKTQTQLNSSVKSLDRLLLEGHYMIPLFFADKQWGVMRATIATPKQESFYGYRIENWWRK